MHKITINMEHKKGMICAVCVYKGRKTNTRPVNFPMVNIDLFTHDQPHGHSDLKGAGVISVHKIIINIEQPRN